MPWGNHKPMADVPGLWENVDARIERSNAIMKVATMLDELLKAARKIGDGKNDEVSSLAMEALEHMQSMLEKLQEHHKSSYTITNELDTCWESTRKVCIEKILKEIDGFKFDETQLFDEMGEKVVRFLQRMRENVLRLAMDSQISLPPVLIKMLASGRVVGYISVPVEEIFFSESEALCGQWCGRMRAISMKWPTLADRKNRPEDFPAILHVRMWFGRSENDWSWKEYIQPADIKSYLEVFNYQRKPKLSPSWRSSTTYTNEKNTDDLSAFTKKSPEGWTYMSNWVVRNSHDMWVCSSDGRQTIEDKLFEVHEWRNGEWRPLKFTDYYGGEIKTSRLSQPGKGWKYEGKWVPDTHNNYGDKSGWVYSITEVFWGEPGTVDTERRADHKYRRRCIKRTRKAIDFKYQNFETYQSSLGDTKWEYASGKNKAFHYGETSGDCIRRRRFVVEIERAKNAPQERSNEMYSIARMYEVHETTTTWQLRCYFLWAKDLLPVVKNSARAFVRVIFLTKSKQTLVVEDSQNPVWNETLIFDKVLITGGKRQISVNPPTIIVETRGEQTNGSEIFLGRFEVNPTVICTSTDSRAKPKWNTLTFQLGKSRGAVLACFELFCQDESTKNSLPLLPTRKSVDDRFEVPGELRPKFQNFAIQVLCWGVRNLKKYQFLSVRKPFLELIIGDMDTRTDPLPNVAKDPNFETPLITFPMVSLPSDLEFSPPLVINLYDTRAFKRQPLVGVCHITNFSRYTRFQSKKKEVSDKNDWSKYDSTVDTEDTELASTPVIASLSKEGKPALDWWSKYYFSLGHPEKAPGFEESGIERLTIFQDALENVNGYSGFEDFLDTFNFVKSSRGNFDDPEEKEKSGQLKGKVFIMPIAEKDDSVLLDPPGVEFLGVVKCLLRVYVVEARKLVSQRKNGMCDPYLLIRCGKKKVSMKKKYRADTVEPVFGECIEMEVNIPVEKDLTVSIMDYRKLISDDTIGSTSIDLENRLLTKWRATVGLSAQYTIQGEMQWRDQQTPLSTLRGYCKKMLVEPPTIIEKENDVGMKIFGIEFWHSQVVQESDQCDKAMSQTRAAAGKEGSDVDDQAKEEESRRKDPDEHQSSWQRGDELRAKRASIAQHGERAEEVELSPEEKLKLRKASREKIVGRPLQQVALYVLRKMNLVPEHVETRTLYTEMGGNTPCGEVRMFVDLFPLSYGPVPPPIDITPRDPERYQLRIALFNVSGAIPVKRSFGMPTSDLYVKIFPNGYQKQQRSDTFFRSLDGCGEFNWRFVFDIEFNPWERKLISSQKRRLFRKASESLVEPLLIIQLWDKNKFRKDVMLGQMVMDMTHFKEGIADPEDIGIIRKRRVRERCNVCSRRCCCVRLCLYCKDTRCGCKIRKKTKIPYPKPMKYRRPPDAELESVNLFDSNALRGWWPVVTDKRHHTLAKDSSGEKKKDDDYKEDDLFIMGLLELEMSLVTAEEAAADPVGKKRKEPNHNPYLPKPIRSKWNMFWITSRIRPCVCYVWHRFGIQILCWTIIILLLFLAIYGLATNWPVILSILAK
nr:FerB and C2 calcium-dependent membrane targeting domain containing protein [Haemonchus contortus]